jgi:thiol-disulfide isomerase/thioredoxin
MMTELPSRTVRAQELLGDFWFNAEPVPLMALRGQVVLLDFWDFTSASSLRWIPYLLQWQEKYGPSGLVLLGVHTPRFAFGRDPERVREALTRYGITYPVVVDNGAVLWSRYGNTHCPTKQLVDRDGFVRVQTTGDGPVLALEHAIQTYLYDAGLLESFPDLVVPLRAMDHPGALPYRSTGEVFSGYVGGSVGNVEGVVPESVTRYADPGLYVDGRVYLQGDWLSSRECVTVAEAPPEASATAQYAGQGAGVVLGTDNRRETEVTVLQDESYLDEGIRGLDVLLSPDGRSYVKVLESRYYNIVRNREVGEHLLRLSGIAEGVSVYSLAFDPGAVPETVEHRS